MMTRGLEVEHTTIYRWVQELKKQNIGLQVKFVAQILRVAA